MHKKEGGEGGVPETRRLKGQTARASGRNQAHNINEHKNQNQAIFSAGAEKQPRKWQNERPELTSCQFMATSWIIGFIYS